MVTTDWYTFGEQWRRIEAGNDMKMGAGMPEHTLKMLQEGKLSREGPAHQRDEASVDAAAAAEVNSIDLLDNLGRQ